MTPLQLAQRVVARARDHAWAGVPSLCDELTPLLLAAAMAAGDAEARADSNQQRRNFQTGFEAYWTARRYYRIALLLEDALDAPHPREECAPGPYRDSAITHHPAALAALDSAASAAQAAGDAWEHARKCLLLMAKVRRHALAVGSVQT